METKTSKETINIYSSGIIERMRKIQHEKGFGFLARKSFVFAWRFLYSCTLLRFRPQRYFSYRGRDYPYFYHPYNFTWDNERSVEIPIISKKLESCRSKRILEAGSVLSHYFAVEWDVLDKFEKGKGIINCDLVDYHPKDKYDLIFSISTLEHVGYDDDIKDSGKILESLDNLKKNCLKPDGEMIFTMPLGYNSFLDDLLFADKLGFDEKYYLKRRAKNKWVEVEREELGDFTYGKKYIEASAIVIAEFKGAGQNSN